MARSILRYRGGDDTPPDDIARIREAPEVTVLDGSVQRMFLVEGTDEAIQNLAQALPGWIAVPERTVPLPDPRPKIRKPG
jgi:hypothetical protein